MNRLHSAPLHLRHGVALSLMLLVASTAALADDGKRRVIGWIERVSVSKAEITLEAKVDTGADFSSVHAERIRHFSRDGSPWVEFTLHDPRSGKHVLQRPLERMAKIKKKDTGFQERPVVLLQLCVGDSLRKVQVNLAQRGHFKYPLLLGRNFLSQHYLVDAGSMYLLQPNCPCESGFSGPKPPAGGQPHRPLCTKALPRGRDPANATEKRCGCSLEKQRK